MSRGRAAPLPRRPLDVPPPKPAGASAADRTYVGRDPDSYDFETIRYEKGGGRATITLGRPEALNAVNGQMLEELNRALKDASWDDTVGVVILTGSGDRAFCTGADLKEQEQFLDRPRDYWKWMGEFIEVHERLRNLGKPTIARLNGIVVGGGNEFNLSCDLSIAADDIYIRHVGTSHGSVALAGATQFLPLVIGERRAREMLLLNEPISAHQAYEWGLVNTVVPRDDLDEAVDELVEKLLDKFPEKTRYTRQQLNFWRDLSWAMTIGHGRDWLALHNTSPETREGVQAFLEKRTPDYRAIRERWAEDRAPEWIGGVLPSEERPVPPEPVPPKRRAARKVAKPAAPPRVPARAKAAPKAKPKPRTKAPARSKRGRKGRR
ncbi:MAG TPA: enoyl-CoA hydratase/isomerase family protein [Anaerolineales bacterium]|nr:enoyl-CoA hydratase/isomerase family protein [Anaerolineales bacterium]